MVMAAAINRSSLLLPWLLIVLSQALCDSFFIGSNLGALVPTIRVPTNDYGPKMRLLKSDNRDEEGFERKKIPILHETDRLLVIDKPSGISHHNDDGEDELGIISLIRQQENCRLYGVHRLDRVTTGVLVLAKDQEMAAELSQAFREKKVDKYYVGISSKKPKMKKQGWVKGYMQRSRNKSWILSRSPPKRNDDPQTKTNEYDPEKKSSLPTKSSPVTMSTKAVTRFFTASLNGVEKAVAPNSQDAAETTPTPKTCILFRPQTGKTHQLRVAAKSVGLALLGDPIYKDGTASQSTTHQRTYLHSTAIHIELSDGPLTVWSPPPFDGLWKFCEENESSPFQDIVTKLMEKHCDVPPIMEAMRRTMKR